MSKQEKPKLSKKMQADRKSVRRVFAGAVPKRGPKPKKK